MSRFSSIYAGLSAAIIVLGVAVHAAQEDQETGLSPFNLSNYGDVQPSE
ncbi:MAG: hypothetical protein MK098_12385 [Marinovum sp.]|nr:hypothetical protein [Marinovum sp.]